MIYDSIQELIEVIKEEECFKSYHDSLQVFKLREVESLMREMNRLNEEKEDLARFGPYCDTKKLQERITNIRRELYNIPEMNAYLSAYSELNEMLDDITAIVFDDISDELAKGRIGRSYARYSR
ncbi:YlbF family regulator [uncultured Catenibacterium sp.]|uniref:YlbF family regulator n=1 Tax=uncultured Catenibacterium sp. TaxID=286142 RepID=UPI0025E4FD05|nr:YlbF family regulator [uncultured Catenibacterium sp.]